jgi:DNA-binding NarL/FixJ family response regulator
VFDPFVIAYRGCPRLLRYGLKSAKYRDAIIEIARRAQDNRLVATVDLADRSAGTSALSPLTPRETEVLELLRLGHTNREIAEALYIEEVTAKVHVRQILRKLGVRSRTEAALLAAQVETDNDD